MRKMQVRLQSVVAHSVGLGAVEGAVEGVEEEEAVGLAPSFNREEHLLLSLFRLFLKAAVVEEDIGSRNAAYLVSRFSTIEGLPSDSNTDKWLPCKERHLKNFPLNR
jgi:hypothetical protein